MPVDANELVIGLVGPVGCDLVRVEDAVRQALMRFQYETRLYKLSDLFRKPGMESISGEIDDSHEYARLSSAMDAGDHWREKTEQPDIMAVHAISEIANARRAWAAEEGREAGAESAAPFDRVAHVLHSLKRPEEARALRQVYGQRFILVSIYVPREDRIERLARKGMTESQAVELVRRDEEGGEDWGQATTETFHFADLFLDGRRQPPEIESEVGRFLDLLFGSRLVTPCQDEHAMFVAFAASLRSGDLSRQVGAVITDELGAILATGCNDAPQFGGGQYWPEDGDARDLAQGEDSNDRIRRRLVREMLQRVDRWQPGEDEFDQWRSVFGEGGILDITEFGRAVHAEMAALTDCARRGVSTKGTRVYCTTFPCHNCVKHLVAAGVERLYFVEPYPKSRAFELHGDSVSANELVDTRLRMLPFVGIGPRRYAELFGMQDRSGRRIKRKGDDGKIVSWEPARATPIVPDSLVSYIDREKATASLMMTIRTGLAPSRRSGRSTARARTT